MPKEVSKSAVKPKIVALPSASPQPEWLKGISLDDLVKEPPIDIKRIAELVEVHPVTAVKLIKNDGLPAKKIGNRWESRETLVKRWRVWYLLQITR